MLFGVGVFAIVGAILGRAKELRVLFAVGDIMGAALYGLWGVWGLVSSVLSVSIFAMFPVYATLSLLAAVAEVGLAATMLLEALRLLGASKTDAPLAMRKGLVAFGGLAVVVAVLQIAATFLWTIA